MVLTAVAGDELPDRETIAEIEAIFEPYERPAVRCPICGFAYLMVWHENVLMIRPPKWWGAPRWLSWNPWKYTALKVLCVTCGWDCERIIDD